MAKKPTDATAPLHEHADGARYVLFNEKVLHGRLAFHVDELVEFEDPAAAAYFDIAFNGTDLHASVPDGYKVSRTLTDEEINFNPDDPRENETIDVHTQIIGRNGVKDGTTVHQVASGNPDAGSGSSEIQPKDVAGTTSAPEL
jgi:hypothetical protein